MKVLQINCVYNFGSTGKIVYDIHSELQKQSIESVVCYGRGKKITEPNIYKTSGEIYSKLNNLLSRFTGLMYGACYFSTKKLLNIIKREKPNVVHLHCLNGYFVNIYKLLDFLKTNSIKTVLTLHAEFMYTGGCGYALDCSRWLHGCGGCPRLYQETKSLFFDRTAQAWQKMKKAFDGFDKNLIVTSVSPWLMERAKQSPILADKNHHVVLNGIDTDIFRAYDTSELRMKHGLTDEKIIFHATAGFFNDPNHIKGGYYVLEVAKRLKNVKIFVAGTYDTSIIPPDNVVLLGRINDQKLLAQYYSIADVTLLTSKKETFSMICAESLCCGTPVVGFKAGAPEQISLPEYSEFVEYGDLNLLENEVLRIDKNIDINACVETYSKRKMVESYHEKYCKLCTHEKGE